MLNINGRPLFASSAPRRRRGIRNWLPGMTASAILSWVIVVAIICLLWLIVATVTS
jgi:hypothetical protein